MTSTTASKARTIKVADEVWIATALLHPEHPEHRDFTINEIIERVRKERLVEPLRPGVRVHVDQHCVANRPPNPGRYRMLFETVPGRRRLFRNGDPYDSRRDGSKITPNPDELPEAYVELLDWYRRWSDESGSILPEEDPLLRLRGSGKHLWAAEHGDDYVRRVREGWQ
jgi:hypothetical protein